MDASDSKCVTLPATDRFDVATTNHALPLNYYDTGTKDIKKLRWKKKTWEQLMLSRREFLEILSHENSCINAIVFLHDWRLEETRCGVESLDSQQGGDKHNPNLCKSSATKI